MKPRIVPLIGGLILCAIGTGIAADDVRKVPLASVYATTRQKDAKDAWAELKGFPPGIYEKWIVGKPAIFLVNGADFPAAVKASRSFLQLQDDATAPDPRAETRAGEPNWVGAYIDSNGSSPPAFRVLAVQIEGRKVVVAYEPIPRMISTTDYYSYLVWAPLGKLSPGEYSLELYDVAAKKVTAARKCKVIE